MSIILPCRPRHLLCPLALALLVACSSTPEKPIPVFEQQQAALVRAENCTNLLQRIQADQIVKLGVFVDEYLNQYRLSLKGEGHIPGYYSGGYAGALGGTSAGSGQGNPSSGAAGSSSAGSSSSGSVPAPNAGDMNANSGKFTGTNTQVESVDEADLIKSDGHRIFAVRANNFYEIDADPVANLGEPNRIQIEGFAKELFIHGKHAIVYSTINNTQSPFEPPSESSRRDYSCESLVTKITVFDISTAGAPKELIARYFEGNYLSARRSDDIIRTVVRSNVGAISYHPAIKFTDIFGNDLPVDDIEIQLNAWQKGNEQAILKTTLSDWIPRTGTSINGQFSLDSDQCESYYSPNSGSVSSGLNTLVTINLKTIDSSWDRLNILGYAGQLYASDNTFLLAQEHYSRPNDSYERETAVHQFSLNNTTGSTHYDASGTIYGHLPSQLGLHEKDGVIFAAARHFQDSSTNIYSLKQSKNELKVLSETPSIAPGERITAVRFIGDKAYVVTYLNTDPLFVVDLKDPQDLKILGELKIPGFSEYVHPLADGQLLTVGRANDFDDKSAIQIFDTSEPTKPKLIHKLTLQNSSPLLAGNDYRAFNFDKERSLLLLPIHNYYGAYKDRLELFKIDVEAGITQLGYLSHSTKAYCYNTTCSNPIKRGFFIDNHIIAMSQRLISSSPISSPSDISSVVELSGGDPEGEYQCNSSPDYIWELGDAGFDGGLAGGLDAGWAW